MKFCKSVLSTTIDSLDPAFHWQFINYKLLKKTLKEMPRNAGGAYQSHQAIENPTGTGDAEGVAAAAAMGRRGRRPLTPSQEDTKEEEELPREHPPTTTEQPQPTNAQIEALSRSPEEAAFFRMVQRELAKTCSFYVSTLRTFQIRLAHVRDGMALVGEDTRVLARQEGSWVHLMRACVNLYKDCLSLETYCIVSWQGFAKILKKHDKVTGFCCRRQFLCRVLNKQPFTHYTELARMLAEVEEIYLRVQELYCCAQCNGDHADGAEMGGSMVLRDDVLFIDAIRGINREVVRRAAEDSAVEEGGQCCKRPKPGDDDADADADDEADEEEAEEEEREEEDGMEDDMEEESAEGDREGGRCGSGRQDKCIEQQPPTHQQH